MILTGNLRDIAGADTDGMVSILSRVTRESTVTPGEMITREIHREPVEDGLFRIEGLDPGPVTIEVEAGNEYSRWDLNLPEGDGEYNIVDLVELQIEWDPEVVGRAQRAQRAAEAAATRAMEGADRVGSAEAVIAAKNAAVAAAGAADTSAEDASRAAGDAARSAGESDASSTTAGQKATAAAGSATAADASARTAAQEATKATSRAESALTNMGYAQSAASNALAAQNAAYEHRTAAQTSATTAEGAAMTATTEAGRAKSEADRAAASAELADGAAVQAVTERVDTLLAGAPEAYDTLLEIATKLSGQDDVAAALTAQIGQKAETSTVTALSSIVDGALVDLSGKLDADEVSTEVVEGVVVRRDGRQIKVPETQTASYHAVSKAHLDNALANFAPGVPTAVVATMPATPTVGTVYFVTGS